MRNTGNRRRPERELGDRDEREQAGDATAAEHIGTMAVTRQFRCRGREDFV